jgi:hypothetical protein
MHTTCPFGQKHFLRQLALLTPTDVHICKPLTSPLNIVNFYKAASTRGSYFTFRTISTLLFARFPFYFFTQFHFTDLPFSILLFYPKSSEGALWKLKDGKLKM